MPAKKAGKKAASRKKTGKTARNPMKKKAGKRPTARAKKPAGPQYSCILCGVEVAVTRAGLGISRLMCCGQPMSRK